MKELPWPEGAASVARMLNCQSCIAERIVRAKSTVVLKPIVLYFFTG
jgi:hypothetical protein